MGVITRTMRLHVGEKKGVQLLHSDGRDMLHCFWNNVSYSTLRNVSEMKSQQETCVIKMSEFDFLTMTNCT